MFSRSCCHAQFPSLTPVHLIYDLNYGSPKMILIEFSQRQSFLSGTKYVRISLEIENNVHHASDVWEFSIFWLVVCPLSLNEKNFDVSMSNLFQKHLVFWNKNMELENHHKLSLANEADKFWFTSHSMRLPSHLSLCCGYMGHGARLGIEVMPLQTVTTTTIVNNYETELLGCYSIFALRSTTHFILIELSSFKL